MTSSKLQTVIDLQKAGYVEDAAGQRGTRASARFVKHLHPGRGRVCRRE